MTEVNEKTPARIEWAFLFALEFMASGAGFAHVARVT